MKKINSSGFVLAETLVVTVFLMYILTMLYVNFYPLIGEYEQRETYDDVDSKYAVYWLKRIIEDSSYNLNLSDSSKYTRFKCGNINDSEKQTVCRLLVKSLSVDGCDKIGDSCNVFITNYRITDFKEVVKNNNITLSQEDCNDSSCEANYIANCVSLGKNVSDCQDMAGKKVFKSGFQDYILTLPDYTNPSLNDAHYRVVAVFHHKEDNNNYYSYSTIEVSK